MTADPNQKNPDLVRQHIEKGRMGDRDLAEKPGPKPPRRGSPEVEEPAPQDEQVNRNRRPDAEENYRTGRARGK